MSKETKKMFFNAALFAGVMFLTFWFVFRGQDMGRIVSAVRKMSCGNLAVSVALSVFFVSMEGVMIWILLRGIGASREMPRGEEKLFRCIFYSFCGFFFSGLTPSASGGQPMQLYYMKKDRHPLSESTVVLMTVALLYKFVLVVCGTGILLFWNAPLRAYLGGYFMLYLIGLSLNVLLVALLLLVMFLPRLMEKFLLGCERLLVKCRIFKEKEARRAAIAGFVESYQSAVAFLGTHKKTVALVTLLTFVQRGSLFVLPWFVYLGFGLSGTDMATVVLLQASVYIAVDMLPVPGAQGITEAMYAAVFSGIFTGNYLPASLCVTRGTSFYLPMLAGGAWFAREFFRKK